MKLRLPYGETFIEARLPDDATVLVPSHLPIVEDPNAAIAGALDRPLGSAPLRQLVRPGASAVVVISDITRPVPNHTLLPPLLEKLRDGGVRDDDVTILIGTGLHRASRPDERKRLLGDDLFESAERGRYRVIDHDARDADSHRFFTTTARGVDVYLNRAYLDADLRIVTGFVEPHLFAGYSGGGKAVLPGIAGAAAIMANHDATMLGHPKATWCTTEGNPIFEEMRDVALRSNPTFALNVTLDESKRITGVFAGELNAAHEAAIARAAEQALQRIPHLFDIVVVTNMGYPADLSLYQAVKGMSVAAQACREGGVILLVAECREGVGGPEYVDLLRSAPSAAELLAQFESSDHRTVHDQWQVQVQAMVQRRADVWLHSSLSREIAEAAHLQYAPDVSDTLTEIIASQRGQLGREPTVCALPFGQLTVPVVAGTS